MLSDELLERLRKGKRPNHGKSVDNEALLDAAKALGVVPQNVDRLGSSAHNVTIDALDRNYPGWRGYDVPETESGKYEC